LRERDRAAGIVAESDPSELRGTGGVLRDVAEAFADDDMLLVANAAQVLVEPLASVAADAAERGGDVTVVANADGTPASLTLISCRALRELPAVGFVDLKEQGLPLMARRHDVRVQTRAAAAGMPIRTPQDYLKALKAYHRVLAGERPHGEAFGERWRRRFALVEDGAVVAADAELHNTVVLRGGRVEAGALVANCVVCDGGVVRRREQVMGRLVDATGRRPVDQEA
jgi:mannose-1-phosphate guanylyltransferase